MISRKCSIVILDSVLEMSYRFLAELSQISGKVGHIWSTSPIVNSPTVYCRLWHKADPDNETTSHLQLRDHHSYPRLVTFFWSSSSFTMLILGKLSRECQPCKDRLAASMCERSRYDFARRWRTLDNKPIPDALFNIRATPVDTSHSFVLDFWESFS